MVGDKWCRFLFMKQWNHRKIQYFSLVKVKWVENRCGLGTTGQYYIELTMSLINGKEDSRRVENAWLSTKLDQYGFQVKSGLSFVDSLLFSSWEPSALINHSRLWSDRLQALVHKTGLLISTSLNKKTSHNFSTFCLDL